jgi:hypothetical protein
MGGVPPLGYRAQDGKHLTPPICTMGEDAHFRAARVSDASRPRISVGETLGQSMLGGVEGD